MKCTACGSSWNAAGNFASAITKCPFCGNELYEKTIEDQMKLLVKKHGIELLNDEKKLNGILVDMFPENSRERSAIKTALGVGAGRMFFELAQGHETNEKKAERLKMIRQRLTDEAWMAEAASDYICKVFLSAIENEALMELDLSNKGRTVQEKDNRTVNRAKETVTAPEAASAPGTLSDQEDSIDAEINRILTAAMNGDADAQYHIGCLYYTGTQVERNCNKALQMFQQAAGKGHANAQNSLGMLYEDSRDVTSAMKWYKKAADNGNKDGEANYDRLRGRYPTAALNLDS